MSDHDYFFMVIVGSAIVGLLVVIAGTVIDIANLLRDEIYGEDKEPEITNRR
jgi:hypothetical protein